MKDKEFPLSDLTKAIMGYVMIMAIILIIFPNHGKPFAIRLANSLPPLSILALGCELMNLIDKTIRKLQSSSKSSSSEA